MPKELTHWLLADRAFAGLDNDCHLRSVIESHHSLYLGGAVLPDTLLHLLRGSHTATALTLAHTFHDTPGNSFAPLIRGEQHFSAGLPAVMLACLLGVLTHIVTDIVFHPFVFALTAADGIGRHYQIETDIDLHFTQSGVKSPVRHLADLIAPDTQEFFISAISLLFDPDDRVPRSALEQALADHCRIQAMYDANFWKLAVRILGSVLGSPYREQRHLFYPVLSAKTDRFALTNANGWRHPVSGELILTTLEELADQAVERISALFERINAAGSLAETLSENPGENLLTGMYGVCLPAMKFHKSG